MKKKRDADKSYSNSDFVAKLRRLADALEKDQRFSIMIAGERISVPRHAICSVEHERSHDEEEIEFQLRWPRKP